MDGFPVLRRELRRLLRPDYAWVLLVLFGLFLRAVADRHTRTGGIMGFLTCVLAIYWAHRAMVAEVEEETIEHLGTLPLSPVSVLMQIGLGSALAATAHTFVGLVAAGSCDVLSDLEIWVRCAALSIVLGWAGAMGGFRFGSSALASTANILWVGPAMSMGAAVLVFCTFAPPVLGAVPATLIVGWIGTQGLYATWKSCGGQWVESLLPDAERTSRAAAAEAALAAAPAERPRLFWYTPDGVSPLAWHELRANVWRVLLWSLWPAALLVLVRYLRGSPFPEGLALDAAMSTTMMGPFCFALVVASRTAQYRRAGLWDDLALTPLPARSVLLGHLLPGLAVLVGSLSCFLLAFFGCGDAFSYWILLAALAVVAAFAGAGLCGFLAGAITTGWKAGLLALFFGWLWIVGSAFVAEGALRILGLRTAWMDAAAIPSALVAIVILYVLGLIRVRTLRSSGA